MSTHTNETDPAFPAKIRMGNAIDGWNEYALGLTAREHAAIALRVPMSGNPWLDEMITEARRWDAAVQVASVQSSQWEKPFDCATYSACFADALTDQMKGESK